MKATTFLVAFVTVLFSAAVSASAKNTILVNRVGPSASELYIANGDGTGEKKLFSAAAFDYDASFSADGQWIVFTSERNRSADIYRVHPDGSGLEQLSSNSGFNDAAALSPDGRQLAFVSTRGAGSTNIWILDMKTHKLRNLTNTGPPTGNFRPAWSPDGKWIAFSSDRNIEADRHVPFDHAQGRWEHLLAASVYVIQPDGKGLRRITPAGKFAGSPKWSPDGKQIVYYELPVEDTFAARGFGPAASEIVSVDVATGARMERTSGPGLKISPQFLSADRIGYLAKAGPRQHGGLAFTTGGRGPDAWIRNPAWSRDGKQVVYEKFIYANRQNDPIFAKDRDFDLRYSGEFPAVSSTGQVALTPLGEITAGPLEEIPLALTDLDGRSVKKIFQEKSGWAFSPAWSPDGQWIAFGFGGFFLDRATKPAVLMMVHADGSGKRDLTSGPLNSGFPSWSPDGKRVVYRIWSQQEHGLRILNVEDGSIKKLTADYDNFPMWSPKGDRIGFTRAGKNAFDIFTIKPDGTGLKQLTDAPGNDAHCAWSPDGQQILFSSSRLGFRDEAPLYDGAPQPYAELFVMNADGSGQRPITDDKWEQGTPAWVPNAVVARSRNQASR
jgi:Tol biopolymer transport system component